MLMLLMGFFLPLLLLGCARCFFGGSSFQSDFCDHASGFGSH
jgi:hypothetical protein